jgi:hypothetical protein
MRSTYFDTTFQTFGFQGPLYFLPPRVGDLNLIVRCGSPGREMSRWSIVNAGAVADGVEVNWKGER